MNCKLFIPTNLQHLRKINKKTQKDVGDLCGKKDTAISNWEKGIREPDATDLGLIANYFNVTVDDLMFKDLRFEKINQYAILYDKIKELPEEKQKIIFTESVMKEIDDQLNGKF